MVNAALENHNYWRDGRVQAAMFSPCWRVVHQEAGSAIINIDSDFLLEDGPVSSLIYDIVDKWIESGVDFAKEYIDLEAKRKEAQDFCDSERISAIEKSENKSWWSVHHEERARINTLMTASRDASHKSHEAYQKLYDKAEEENLDRIIGELGFQKYRNSDGEEFEFCIRVRTEFAVCGQCRGSGKVVNPNIDAGGLTEDDFRDDPDFEENYFSGAFDITCPNCGGKRVEAIPQFPEWLNKAIQERDESVWEGIRELCAERARGA